MISVHVYTIYIFSTVLLWISGKTSDGACTWPADFVYSTWIDSTKGELVFQNFTMTGWSYSALALTFEDWDCYSTEYLESHGYLIMKTKDSFVLYNSLYFDGYRCLHLTKITEASYRYYEIDPIQGNMKYDRIIAFRTTSTQRNLSDLCLTENGASGSEYKLLIKKGYEEEAKLNCPYNLLRLYDYNHTSSAGDVTCIGDDTFDMCSNNEEMRFSYDTCSTLVTFSKNNTVWCVDVVPVNGNIYVTVFNGFDVNTDEVDTYRFTCIGFSADGTSASVTPQNCKKDQTPYDVPVDNAGVLSGATLTLSSISDPCPPCPELESPPNATVSIETYGAVTTATYQCTNNYNIQDGTRICQKSNTWSGNAPSCTPTSPDTSAVSVSPTSPSTAAIIGGVLGSLALVALVVILILACKTCSLGKKCLSDGKQKKNKIFLGFCIKDRDSRKEKTITTKKDLDIEDLPHKRFPVFIHEQPAIAPNMTALDIDASPHEYKPSTIPSVKNDHSFRHNASLTPVETPDENRKSSKASFSSVNSLDKLRNLSSVSLDIPRGEEQYSLSRSLVSAESPTKASLKSIEYLNESVDSGSLDRVSSLSKYLQSTQCSNNHEFNISNETASLSSRTSAKTTENHHISLGLKPIIPISACDAFNFDRGSKRQLSSSQEALKCGIKTKELNKYNSKGQISPASFTTQGSQQYSESNPVLSSKRRHKSHCQTNSRSSDKHVARKHPKPKTRTKNLSPARKLNSQNSFSSEWTTIDQETVTNSRESKNSKVSVRDINSENTVSSQWITVDEETITDYSFESVSRNSNKNALEKFQQLNFRRDSDRNSPITQSSQWTTVDEETVTNSTIASRSSAGLTKPRAILNPRKANVDQKGIMSSPKFSTAKKRSESNESKQLKRFPEVADKAKKMVVNPSQTTYSIAGHTNDKNANNSSYEIFLQAHGHSDQVYSKSANAGLYYTSISNGPLEPIEERSEQLGKLSATQGNHCTDDYGDEETASVLYSENTFTSQWTTVDEETVSGSTEEPEVHRLSPKIASPMKLYSNKAPLTLDRQYTYNGYEPDTDEST